MATATAETLTDDVFHETYCYTIEICSMAWSAEKQDKNAFEFEPKASDGDGGEHMDTDLTTPNVGLILMLTAEHLDAQS